MDRNGQATAGRYHTGRRVVLAALLGLTCWPASAQQDAAPVTLHDAFAATARLLPEAAATSAVSDEYEARRRAAHGPFVGPPTVRGDVYITSRTPVEENAALSASLRWPGESRAGVTAATRGRDAAGAAIDAARLRLAGEVRTAWWNLAAARADVEVSQTQLATAEAQLASETRLERAGVEARRVLLLAQAERDAARARLTNDQTRVAEAEAALAALIGPAPAVLGQESAAPSVRPDNHPEVRAADARAAAAGANAAYLRYSVWPRIEGSIGYRRELDRQPANTKGVGSSSASSSNANELMVGIAIPLGRNNVARADAAQARGQELIATAEAARTRARIAADQRAATARLASSRLAAEQAQSRYAALAQSLALTEKGVREGEVGFIELLRARQGVADADRARAAAQVAASAAVSSFNQSMGVLP